ncbi:BolA domain UV induced protein Uvi31 [Blastocladiella emersonii ATCC 22665]|nr:BolA domain UV induced protein Uvi31 [Blastocladiella emersonii ATCC 22665]
MFALARSLTATTSSALRAATMSTTAAAAPAASYPAGSVAEQIHVKLTAACAPEVLEILDDSSKHAGHAAMKGLKPVETHFRVTVVSPVFLGKPLIARHRLIYEVLGDELRAGLHALQLRTKTPAEWAKETSQ